METILQVITAADFQEQLGTDFFIHFSDKIICTAQLEKVLPLPAYAFLDRKPFSVLLQTTDKDQYYPQAIYSLEHPALGIMQIFLVPVKCNKFGMQYEAVFS